MKVIPDLTTVDALVPALAGCDAVIDTTAPSDVETPLALIAAAHPAGVYRFIRSDFGLDSNNEKRASCPSTGAIMLPTKP